jgi:epoxyqueuosine reductase
VASAEKRSNYKALRECALGAGASLFGVCRISDLKKPLEDISPEALAGLEYAVSMGVPLAGRIVDDIKDRPTKLYFYHYKQVNYLLDRIALQAVKFMQDRKCGALPVPASQVIDQGTRKGHLSHRDAAALAGLGWIGRNNLLVNPGYGARLRLVTVLTDLPLAVDNPAAFGCGFCMECVKACPAGAIKERREEFDADGCFSQLDKFRNKCGIGHHICGICVKACKGRVSKDKLKIKM